MGFSKKVIILTYYWPPSGGSGVQRWVYFAKHLKAKGWTPIVITVDENQAAYPQTDKTLAALVDGIRTVKTASREPLKWYARLFPRATAQGLPQGEVSRAGLWAKLAAFIRGNFFIPDARKGWVPYAVNAAQSILEKEDIHALITTGPPHSTHLAGYRLKKKYPQLQWWVDFRDPWTTVFYNALFYRTPWAKALDKKLESRVINHCSGAITTIEGTLTNTLKQQRPNLPIAVLANGYDANLMASIDTHKPKDVFHIVYTGLLTQQQDYAALLEAINGCTTQRPIRFSLAGQIAPVILQEIKHALPDVEVIHLGYLPQEDAIWLMKSAHLLVNFVFKGAEKAMISGKLLSYLATTVPVLSFGDPQSAAAKLMEKSTHACMFASGETQQATAFIQQLLAQEEVVNIFPEVEHWSRANITQALIDQVLTKRV